MFHFTMDAAKTTGQLSLTGDMTIRNATDFKEALSNAMDQSQQLELNLSEVERVDLTTLQILCAANRTCLRQNKKLTIVGSIPNILRETVQQAGFTDCGSDKETSGLWMGVTN
ncbi:MAG: STAS domain-containing protein [Magnetococcales bacterium]|nr:STAS domain-containing protein [Magnetococcales bacterium]MBF0438863.1 STAS domain-containing protein [Magnetococcales bacterium]